MECNGSCCRYEVYNLVNKRFPGWSDPPGREQILEVMAQYDVNKDSQVNAHSPRLVTANVC